jgi:hypothetical protein
VRGNKAAVLVDGGATVIYDSAAKTATTLDSTERTYSVQTRDQLMAQGGPIGRSAENIKLDAKVDVKRQTETKTIAGQSARRYTVTGRLTMSPKQNGPRGGGGRGGGRRGGGGFPGGGRFPGGFPFQRGGSGMPQLPTIDLTGDIWLADSPPVQWDAKDKDAPLPLVAQLMPPNPLVAPLTEKLSKLKGFPLESDLALSVSNKPGDPPTVVQCTVEIESVGNGNVEDSAFQVPAEYKLESPQTAETLFKMPEGRTGSGAPPR